MKEITLEELLEAGCHFGHQVTRQNPKARDFVFEARDNIHIIDLAKTKDGLDAAAAFVKEAASTGKTMLMVATKRQARPIVTEEIKKITDSLGKESNFYFVTNRWIGGILTNYQEVAKNFKKLGDIEKLQSDENERTRYTKKELGDFEKSRQKLESFYGGIKYMKQPPDVLFIVDTHLEDLAVREAHATNVVTVGMVDTNADPAAIDYPIPANDDAVGSLKLIMGHIVDAWIEGKKNPKEVKVVEESKEKEETKEPEKKETVKEQKKEVSEEKKTVKKRVTKKKEEK